MAGAMALLSTCFFIQSVQIINKGINEGAYKIIFYDFGFYFFCCCFIVCLIYARNFIKLSFEKSQAKKNLFLYFF